MNPIKYLIKDLPNKPAPFDVWLQGTFSAKGTMKGTTNEYITISDSTGQVKVSGCDFTDVIIGDYCCVLGVAVSTDNIPEIKAAKLIKISGIHEHSWELEVQETQMILQGIVAPKI